MTISIVDFASLQTGIDNWLNRTDFNGSRDLDFIGLFESWFAREAMRNGGFRQMESRSNTLSISTQYTALPAGFLGMRNIRITSLNPEATLTASTQRVITENYAWSTGQPVVYAVVGTDLLVGPTPDTTYTATVDMYAFTGLSVAAPTNWLILAHPDLYLYGALAEAEPFIKDGNVVGYWETRRNNAFQSLVGADAQGKWAGSPLTMKPSGPTP